MSDTAAKQQSRKLGESKYPFERCRRCVGKPERKYCDDCRRTLNQLRNQSSRERQNPNRSRQAATPGTSQFDFGRCEACIGKTIKKLCDKCQKSYWKITREHYSSHQHQGQGKDSKYEVELCTECADKPQRQQCDECKKKRNALAYQNNKHKRRSKAKGLKPGPKPGTPSPLRGTTRFDYPRCSDCVGKALSQLCQICWQQFYKARYRWHNGPFIPQRERKFSKRGVTRFRRFLCDKCVGKARRDYCPRCSKAYQRAVAAEHYRPSSKPSAPHVTRAYFEPCANCLDRRVRDFCRSCKRFYRRYSGTHHRHRAKKLGLICEHGLGCVPPTPILAELQGWKCAFCGADLKRTGFALDHFRPLQPRCNYTPPGLHCITNVQVLCLKCNWRKNSKDPVEWAQEWGRLFCLPPTYDLERLYSAYYPDRHYSVEGKQARQQTGIGAPAQVY